MPDAYRQFGRIASSALISKKKKVNMGLGNYAARMAIQGGIGLATNLGSSLFNSALSGRAADEQYNRQLEFWRMQNNYNSPLNQRMRLSQAGFNPASAVGEVASSQAAGELSSVPGNEVMKNGAIDLSSLVDSLKAITELESIAAGNDLTSSKIATEALIQVAQMFGIKGKEIENALNFNKLFEDNATIEQRISHILTMYDLEESFKQADIEYKEALTTLSNAHTEESKQNAQKIAAEKGLIAIKAETERSIQSYNFALAKESKSKTDLNDWQLRKSIVLAPLERRAMELANDVKASEAQKNEIEAALKKLDLDAKSNDKTGEPNAWYYIDETLETISSILGIAAGVYLGGKGAKTTAPSSLYTPSSTKFGGETWSR